jgi:nucleoside-triphosphatase THEP1
LCVTGIAGSGKSTLSATIVDNRRENNTPVSALFFISRNIPETIDPDKIIPTIAQQHLSDSRSCS